VSDFSSIAERKSHRASRRSPAIGCRIVEVDFSIVVVFEAPLWEFIVLAMVPILPDAKVGPDGETLARGYCSACLLVLDDLIGSGASTVGILPAIFVLRCKADWCAFARFSLGARVISCSVEEVAHLVRTSACFNIPRAFPSKAAPGVTVPPFFTELEGLVYAVVAYIDVGMCHLSCMPAHVRISDEIVMCLEALA
jgi:hypothetical protein